MVKVDGEFTQLKDASGTRNWKTQNGQGAKLTSGPFNTQISVLLDNVDTKTLWLKDANTMVIQVSSSSTSEFTRIGS